MRCSECEGRRTRARREMPPMAIAESFPAKREPEKTKGKPTVTTKKNGATKINELERKVERLESMVESLKESSPLKGEPEKSKGKPPGTAKDDKAAKINELVRKLERLESMIEGLREEVNERAMEDAGAGAMDPVCNTCLVRKKGAALFPCGHTFCWKCTSDLRRGKGPCPVCSHYFWNVLSVSEVP